jgi:hypothetical protein
MNRKKKSLQFIVHRSYFIVPSPSQDFRTLPFRIRPRIFFDRLKGDCPMRFFRFSAALALLLVVAASPAFADIALPDTRTKAERLGEVRRDLPSSRMSIERVEGLREARLQIPRSQLSELGVSGGLEQTSAPSGTFKGAGTVVAGLFLSLAVVLTGVLLVRSRRRGGLAAGRAAVLMVVCACVAGLAAVAAYANIAPPGIRPQDPGTLIKAVSGQALKGSIRVEVVENGTEIKLLVPATPRKANGDEEE